MTKIRKPHLTKAVSAAIVSSIVSIENLADRLELQGDPKQAQNLRVTAQYLDAILKWELNESRGNRS